MLGQELLFLLLEPLLELVLDLLLLLLELLLQVEEAFVDVLHLLVLEPLKLFLDLLQKLTVFVIQALSVEDHLLEVKHVLLERGRHLFDLDKLVPVVLIKDAFDANCLCT